MRKLLEKTLQEQELRRQELTIDIALNGKQDAGREFQKAFIQYSVKRQYLDFIINFLFE